MKEITQIIRAFDEARRQGRGSALATVVHVQGSSYRGAGARMLVSDDGRLTGAVSGGCLEGDALRKALMVIQQDTPLLVTYDTTEDEDSGIGIMLGCRGVIRVLIEPIRPGDAQNPICVLKRLLEERSPAVLVTLFSPEEPRDSRQGTRIFARRHPGGEDEGTFSGSLDADMADPAAACSLRKDIRNVLEAGQPAFLHYGPGAGGMSAFLDYVKPAVSLVIGGAGNDVLPLVEMAELMGWDTTVIDGRPAYANSRRFATCQVVVAEPDKAHLDQILDARTACVVMSHNYHYDKALLRRFIAYEVPYIGMLGPKKKFERIVRELTAEGLDLGTETGRRMYGPVGLDIGASTPEEIACSIIAEINMVFSGGTGRPLRTFAGKIHPATRDIIERTRTAGPAALSGKS
jgi:xanthine/CO dehydrogenase XdhC/CoxF family maturation factor